MGIFSLLFRKNNVLTEDESFEIQTVETVSSKIEVVYLSGMKFKSVDSYTPNIDIMEIVVPIAMDVFKEDYTVYFTEKLLSSTLNKLDLNLSLRKELHLMLTGETINLDTFKLLAKNEISLLDISFIEKIIRKEIDIPTYIRIRQVLLESFKKAGETDPYFNEMHTVFSFRFLEYSEIDKVVNDLTVNQDENLESISDVFYIHKPNTSIPSKDIMYLASENLQSKLSSVYDYNYVNTVLSKTINFLNRSIKEKLDSFEGGLSSIDYLSEIKKAVEEMDLHLLDMIKNRKIDETTYFTLQEVLTKSFIEAKCYDLYVECISVVLSSHIDENKFFKEYISLKVYDMFKE